MVFFLVIFVTRRRWSQTFWLCSIGVPLKFLLRNISAHTYQKEWQIARNIAHIFYKYSCHMHFIIIVIVTTSAGEHSSYSGIRFAENDGLACCSILLVTTVRRWNCKKNCAFKFHNNEGENMSIFYFFIYFRVRLPFFVLS